MLKLITISCIIVVTLNFQKVEGLDPLSSIPYIVKNPIPDIVKNSIPDIVKNHIPNILPKESLINSLIKSGIEDAIKGMQQKIQDINLSCLELYVDGNKLFTQLSSIFSSCFKQKTEIRAADTKELNNLINNFKENLRNNVRNTSECLREGPFNVLSCVNKSIAEVNSTELITVAKSEILSVYPFSLIISLPDVLACGEKVINEFKSELFRTFLSDAKQCFDSIKQLI